jgi:hypothetical protein
MDREQQLLEMRFGFGVQGVLDRIAIGSEL